MAIDSIVIPTIHLNGTSRDTLLEALMEASQALNDAYKALKETAPNGRDYYTQGGRVIGIASNQHMNRLRRLDSIKAEIDHIAQEIAD